jgi:hypothetical protein
MNADVMPLGWWPEPDTHGHEPDPAQALEDHVALIRALRQHRYPLSSQSAGFQDALAFALDAAETIIVTHQLLDFVLERAETVPLGQPLYPEMLPFPSAFVVLPRNVLVPLNREEEAGIDPPRHIVAHFDMCAWLQAGDVWEDGIEIEDGATEPPDPTDAGATFEDYTSSGTRISNRGIGYFQMMSAPMVHRGLDHLERDIEFGDGSTLGTYSIPAPLPVYSSGWKYGVSWDPEARGESFALTEAGAWERRFWLALFATLNEQVEITRPHLDRATRRRAMRGREVTKLPDVVVCNLRMLTKKNKDGSERRVRPKPEWQHRWRSRAHDRTLYRGTPQERVVPVKASIKGPDWAPLIEKDRVYRLAR